MSSLFGRLFACCLRSSDGSSNERTPILNHNQTPPVYVTRDTVNSDRQRVKERLDNIVRSKERKMVNVTDHLPFNLQNRDDPAGSTSRLRAESPSPHPSIGTTETTTTTSRSNSSLRPRVGRSCPAKEPALSVRLVRGRDGNHRGTTSRGRLGRFGEERGVEWTRSDVADGAEGSSDTRDIPELHVSDPDAVPPEVVPLETPDRENLLTLSAEIGKKLRDGWKIEDTGPISRGWGD